ncbi:MAG: glycosyltransferase [Kiritimatiellia bacterium]
MSEDFPTVSVVIPIKNAEAHLPELLRSLLEQVSVPLAEILLLDSMSTDRSREIAEEFDKVRIIPEPCFSHGGTRNRGIEAAAGEWIVLMTQDALPQGREWMHSLLAPLAEARVAYTFSRQIPYPGTNPMEDYYLRERFPAGEPVRYDSPSRSIDTLEQVFCSNVSAGIKKSLWAEFRFDEDVIMGEDQKFSMDLQEAGYTVIYVPDSVVMHSHNYSLLQTFRRYFDSVVAITQIFPGHELISSAGTGIDHLKGESRHLFRHHPMWLPYYFLYLSSKTLATLLAHMSDHLPNRLCKACSMHSGYWARLHHS